MDVSPWFLVTIVGPVVLLVALIWARTRSGKAARRADPTTPPDDPSKGM